MAGIENNIVFGGGFKLETSSSRDISDMQRTSTDVSRINHTGSPEGVISANPSSLSHDPVAGIVYIKTAGVGNTGWSAISLASGTVTSVSGTANRITSTGGTTPVIDISASYVGQASITTLGTITTGVWNGTVIGVTFGGTGLNTVAAGDMLYASALNTISRLPTAADGKHLTLVSGLPTWSTPTFPNVATGTGTILRANGTNWVATTATYPNTAAQGDLFFASAANVYSNLTKSTTATRYLANTGTNNSPQWDQVDLSNGVINNLPVTNLNSGTSASATTFWRGDGTWATPAGSGVSSVSGTTNRITSTGGATPVIDISTTILTAAFEFLAGNGSLTNPSFSFQSDPNTGVYRKGADQLGFVAGGVEISYADSTGFNTNISYVLRGISGSYTGSQEIALQAGVQTTDATVTNLATILVNQGEMVTVQGIINGFRSTFAEAVGVRFLASARRATGGNIILIGLPIIESVEDSTGIPNVQIDADTGTQTLRIRVQGETSKTFNWVGTYRYHKTLTNA